MRAAVGPALPLGAVAALRGTDEPGVAVGPGHWMANGRMYGGLAIGQAVLAAQRTVPDGMLPVSLQGNFHRAGRANDPVRYRVDSLADDPDRAVREVWADQEGTSVYSCLCSFAPASEPDPAPPIALVPPAYCPPAMLPPTAVFGLPDRYFLELLEIRRAPAAPGGEPHQSLWFRPREAMTDDDPAVHRAMVAYLSDFRMVASAFAMHPEVPPTLDGMWTASLDHSLWWHRDARADDWLLFTHHSTFAGGGRTLVRGSVRDAGGHLVASYLQEILIRRDA